MKRILVPTDFSKPAENALAFANKLAARLGADIVLLHCAHIPELSAEAHAAAVQKLQHFSERLRYQQPVRQEGRRIRYDYVVQQGCLQNHVLNLAEKNPFDLIVMPLEFSDCEPAEFPGSHAASLMEVVECPVLLVPNNARLQQLSKLVFATDFTDQDPRVLQQIGVFAEIFHSHLSVVQVYGKAERNQLHVYKQGIKELQQTIHYPALSCHLVEEEDLLEGICDFAEKQQADMLVLATQDSFLFRNLFDISYTKTRAYHTQVPVLAFHQHKQKPCASCCKQCADRKDAESANKTPALLV